MPLLDAILNGEGMESLRGVAYNTASGIEINPRAEPVRNLDEIPFPAWDLFPMEKLATCLTFVDGEETDRFMSLLTSRGCVNKCSFCYRMEQGIRIRSIENVYEELKVLLEYKINYFLLMMKCLFQAKKESGHFVEMIKRLKYPIKYYAQSRVELAKM